MRKNPVVILTREHFDNVSLLNKLKKLNISVLEYPCMETVFNYYQRTDPVQPSLEQFQVLVFTSKRGILGMKTAYKNLAGFKGLVAVVGESTGAFFQEKTGRTPDIVAHPPHSEGLAQCIISTVPVKSRILQIKGNKSSGMLEKLLETKGYQLIQLVVYENRPPLLKPLPVTGNEIVVFASPSAVRSFFSCNPPNKVFFAALAIGPVTAGYLRETGYPEIHEADKPEESALIDKINSIIQRRSIQ